MRRKRGAGRLSSHQFIYFLSFLTKVSGAFSQNASPSHNLDQLEDHQNLETTHSMDNEMLRSNQPQEQSFSQPPLVKAQIVQEEKSLKGVVERLNNLESNVLTLNNRVGSQEHEIISLKSFINNGKIEGNSFENRFQRSVDILEKNTDEPDYIYSPKRDKRQLYSPAPCNPKVACAFDTSDNDTKITSKIISQTKVTKPTSCDDLKSMGHMLNGFYLVEANQTNTSLTNVIQTVYCDFSLKKLQAFMKLKTVITEKIGYVDIKSRTLGVQFYVQRDLTLSGTNVKITFQIERLNVGRAMNLDTGIFTAPVSGTYFFTFTAVKGRDPYYGSEVYLYHNDEQIGTAYGTTFAFSTLSLNSVLKLQEGDKVYLQKGGGDVIIALDDTLKRLLHFSGWLLEEGPKK